MARGTIFSGTRLTTRSGSGARCVVLLVGGVTSPTRSSRSVASVWRSTRYVSEAAVLQLQRLSRGCRYFAELSLTPGSQRIEVEGVRQRVRRVSYDGPSWGWDLCPPRSVVQASLEIAVVEDSMAKATQACRERLRPVVMPVCQLGGLPSFRVPEECPYIAEQTVS